MKILECDILKFEKVVILFFRILYDDVIEFLKVEGFDDIEWGEDFGVLYEIVIVNYYDLLVFIINYLIKIKFFYM